MVKKPKIVFKNDTHEYTLHGKKGRGAHGLIGLYHDGFDSKYWSEYKGLEVVVPDFKALKSQCFPGVSRPDMDELKDCLSGHYNEKDLPAGIQKIKGQWQESRDKGTAFHNRIEKRSYDMGFVLNPLDDGAPYDVKGADLRLPDYDNHNIVEHLSELEDGCYPELLVWNEELMLFGQVDEPFFETVNGVRYVDIGDHKTDKRRPRRSNGFFGMMYPPIDNLSDDTYTEYELQLSIYGYLLELAGYTVRNIGFYHYLRYDESTKKVMECDYLRAEVEDMIEDYVKKYR